jgi:phenylalanyl-tRNA synthetase alpha chain
MTDLEVIKSETINKINNSTTLAEIEAIRVEYLGKSGHITLLMKTLSGMNNNERKEFGALINQLKSDISEKIDNKKSYFEAQELNSRLNSEKIDITLPVRETIYGKIHPITQSTEELVTILAAMGFYVVEGPEIENDYNNFTALNIPEHHPARLMHDTFYLPKNSEQKTMLLRTHTSSVQIRTMQQGKPPFRIISPGRTYRCDSDMTHTPMFHQIEGLLIDKNIDMGHLKGCILELLRKFFELDDLPIRFRSSFFPFTEPSAEVDIGCLRQNGELKIGAGSDWLEVLGCGMVHPNVLKNVGINPDEYQGFAFGMGIERMAMLKYGITDLRTFFEGDQRWINHYGFSAFDIPSLVGGLSR